MPSMIQTSFAGGELSSSMFGRVDLAKYYIGAAELRNFFVDYRGGASTRPGSKFVARAKELNARLLTFKFNAEQTYILEFGNQYMRVHYRGNPVTETPISITGISGDTVESAGHGFAVGDWIYFADISGAIEYNLRTLPIISVTTDTFTLGNFSGGPIDFAPSAYTGGGTAARVYTLPTPYATEHLSLLKFVQSQDVVTITHPLYKIMNLTRSAHNQWALTEVSFDPTIEPPPSITAVPITAGTEAWFGYCVTAVSDEDGTESVPSPVETFEGINIGTTAGSNQISWPAVPKAAYYNIYKAQVSPDTDVPIGSTYGYMATAYGLSQVDGNIVPDFTKTPPTHRDPFAPGQILRVRVINPGSGASSSDVTITDPTGEGAIISAVNNAGATEAFIIQRGGKNYTAPVISVAGNTDLEVEVDIGPSEGTFPGVSCYFQQRQIYAASLVKPQTLWASKPGAFKNMDVSIPTLPDDALTLTLASNEVNDIKALQPMPGGLIVLTGSGAWQVSGGANGEALSATSALATPQAFNGASDVTPLLIGHEILYIQSKGSTVRNLSYSFNQNIYTGVDLSVLSNHLFTGRTIREWSWAEEPFKLVTAVRDDGELLVMTFLKEHELFGWTHWDTQGMYRSVATIREGNEDFIYTIVRRKIQGQWVEYIERFASRYLRFGLAEEAWCLDSALELVPDEPEAEISISAASGSVEIEASAAVFSTQSVGRVLRAGGGVIDISTYISPSKLSGTVRSAVLDVIPQTGLPKSFTQGNWNIVSPVTTIRGLEHLEGQTVKAVGDGSYIGEFVVANGSITVPHPVSKLTVGLGYRCKLKTLPLEVNQPTIQGKMKKISKITVLVNNTRGIKFGFDDSSLTEPRQWDRSVNLGNPMPLRSGQFWEHPGPNWTVEGQIVIQQDYPMPATILAVVPDVQVSSS